MFNKKCIHCGRTMSCDDGEAHHKCSRNAQKKIDKLLSYIDTEVRHAKDVQKEKADGNYLQYAYRISINLGQLLSEKWWKAELEGSVGG